MTRADKLRALAERVMQPGYTSMDLTSEIVAEFGVHQRLINWGRRTAYRRWAGQWCAPLRPQVDLNDLSLLLAKVGMQDFVAPICARRATAAALLALAEREEA